LTVFLRLFSAFCCDFGQLVANCCNLVKSLHPGIQSDRSLPQKKASVHDGSKILFRWQNIAARLQKLVAGGIKILFQIAVLADYPRILPAC